MGTEAFWVPVAVAALSGGAEYANKNAAQKRESASVAESIRDQQALQTKAAGQANALTQQIASNNPDQIAAKATGEYVSQLRKNSASASSPAVAGASARYKADSARADQSVKDYGDTNASELGTIDAAVRQRQNEGQAMQDYGTNLNVMNAQSFAKSFVDQLRTQAAGTANPLVSLGAGMVNSGARSYYGAAPKATNPYAKVSAGGYDGLGNPLWAGGDMTGVPA